MAFLHSVEGSQEFMEGLVAGALAGEAHESGDGEAECLQVDIGVRTADEFETLEAAEPFSSGGGREADAPA